MKTNYHTHTTRCLHAKGTGEEYVLAAIAEGFDELGFADHGPWKYDSDYVASMRMPLDAFEDYKSSVLKLKEKYADQISIKLGLEYEYFPGYTDWLRGFLDRECLDYIIFGNHHAISDEVNPYFGYHADLDLYLDSMLAGMDSDLYAYVAHPDLIMRPYGKFDSAIERVFTRICRRAKENGRILEYNLLGLRRWGDEARKKSYPNDYFWEIAAAEGCTAIIGTDAHAPEHLKDGVYRKTAEDFLNSLGIEVVETFPMRQGG
ncbi:MAG: histidinol-phosphatase [Christensenellales bacterium]|jgi:histidinol-phosphatase (PHP family)